MLVTVYCNTYQRCPYPLEELVYCFLAQDYPKKELIIANDDPDLKIEFKHPDVTIINHKSRFSVLFDKSVDNRKYGTGELMVEWGDDDLYAPWALSSSVRFWKESDKPIVAFPLYYKSTHPSKFELKTSPMQSTYILERDAWKMFIGDYVSETLVELRPYELAGRNEKKLYTYFKIRKLYGQSKMTEDDISFLWRISRIHKWGRENWKANDKSKFKDIERDPEVCVLEPKMKYSFEKFGYI